MLPLQAKRLGQKRLVEGEAGHVELLLRWGENKVFCSDQNALPCVILVMNIMSYCYCYLYSQSYFNRIVRVLVFNRTAEFLFQSSGYDILPLKVCFLRATTGCEAGSKQPCKWVKTPAIVDMAWHAATRYAPPRWE